MVASQPDKSSEENSTATVIKQFDSGNSCPVPGIVTGGVMVRHSSTNLP